MASVSSLDKDLASLRLSKYTPTAAAEAKEWIENVLQENIFDRGTDLMEGLRDGIILCRLVNKLVPGAAKYKDSAMPFVQMENISLFLRIMSKPPISLHEHDLFLTVDLYELKDPAQVLQTIQSFSRIAHSQNPKAFPQTMGPKIGGLSSPTRGGFEGKAKPPVPGKKANVSNWGNSDDVNYTNIWTHGYQNKNAQNVVMGGRRQITTAGPYVPGMKDKEERRRVEEHRADEVRKAELDIARQREEEEEERARQEEEALWREKEARMRRQQQIEDERRRRVEEEAAASREREEQQIRGHEQEKQREKEEAMQRQQEARRHLRTEAQLEHARQVEQQYVQKEEAAHEMQKLEDVIEQENIRKNELERERFMSRQRRERENDNSIKREYENERIAKLEAELEQSRRREMVMMKEREELLNRWNTQEEKNDSSATPATSSTQDDEDERRFLKEAHDQRNKTPHLKKAPVPTPSSRPLPDPRKFAQKPQAVEQVSTPPPTPPRHATTSNYNNSNNEQSPPRVDNTKPNRFSGGSRIGTLMNKAGQGVGGSLIEREIERERQRQREWERDQSKVQEDYSLMTDEERERSENRPGHDSTRSKPRNRAS